MAKPAHARAAQTRPRGPRLDTGDPLNTRRGAGKGGVSWADVCRLALRLPGVSEGTSYGTPALHVRKRFLARLKEDGETMALKMGFPERELLLELHPDAFFLTDHYRPYPAILVRLTRVQPSLVPQLLEQAWLFQAPKSLKSPGKRPSRKRGGGREPT